MRLSYSTIANTLQPQNSHNFVNKNILGLKPEERPEWKEGKVAHDIIQKHVSGRQPHMVLSKVKELDDVKFPIVETKDFDPKCRIEVSLNQLFPNKTDFEHDYTLLGFIDGRDEEWTRGLEIKTSSNLWSLMKFKKAMQRKVYCFAVPTLKSMTLITTPRNEMEWASIKPKVYTVPTTEKDKIDAMNWILAAIALLQSGDFTGGLNEDGICTDKWCYFGRNCSFKRG